MFFPSNLDWLKLKARARNFIIAVDTGLIVLGDAAAILFRFDGRIPHHLVSALIAFIAIDVIVFLIIHLAFGIKELSVRYTSIHDAWVFFKAIAIRSIVIICCFYLIVETLPRSVIILSSVFALLSLCGSRLVFRFLTQLCSWDSGSEQIPVFVIGTDAAGENLCRQLLGSSQHGYNPLGFITLSGDDEGKKIHNIPVLGRLTDLALLAISRKVKEVIVARSRESEKASLSIYQACQTAGLSLKIVPSMKEILKGGLGQNSIRNFRIEDLIPREIVSLDKHKAGRSLRDASILVTGAGGSIGSELCRQICSVGPGRLILYEKSENDLFYINTELREEYNGLDVIPVIGDIQDIGHLRETFRRHGPDIVYHAAAFKHVPLMESHPIAAVRNNIFGTWNLAKVSIENKVKKFVFISTDKAVNPVSIMGTTKRASEILLQKMKNGSTDFISVRFGNVLGSKGSVFTTFLRQIEKGSPLTVTHPEMKRYFMTIPEAVQLVIEAGAMGRNGNLFYLDMGEPIRLVDLARNMISLATREKSGKIDIVFTGRRSGEKLDEELLIDSEKYTATEHEKIWRVKNSSKLDGQVWDLLNALHKAARRYDEPAAVRILSRLVPEFQPEYDKTISTLHDLKIAIEKNGKENFVGSCSILPGVVKSGESPDEVIDSIQEEFLKRVRKGVGDSFRTIEEKISKSPDQGFYDYFLPVDIDLD